MMKKRIMITGAEGFMGSRLAARYGRQDEILAVSHEKLNIAVEEEVIQFVKEFHPDLIFHCAAISNTETCENHPQLSREVNVCGTANLAKACSMTGSRLVFMSSDQIYAESRSRRPNKETDEMTYVRVYSKHKKEAEESVMSLLPDGICLRLPWMYDFPARGWKGNSNFLCGVIRSLIQNEPMMAPVHDYRGITWVWEVVEHMEAAARLPGGIYNFGSENSSSTYETAKSLMKILAPGREDLIHQDEQRFADHPRNLAMDTGKLQSCGIRFYDTAEGFSQCLKKSPEYAGTFFQ